MYNVREKNNNLKPLEFNEMVKNSAFAALDIFSNRTQRDKREITVLYVANKWMDMGVKYRRLLSCMLCVFI